MLAALEEKYFYHGELSEDEVEYILHLKGQFLLWKKSATTRRPTKLFLSVCDGSCVVQHIQFARNINKWYICKDKEFHSPEDLILHYMNSGEEIFPNSGLTLLNAVQRQDWNISEEEFTAVNPIWRKGMVEVVQGKLLAQGTSQNIIMKTYHTGDFALDPPTEPRFNFRRPQRRGPAPTSASMSVSHDQLTHLKESGKLHFLQHSHLVKLWGVCLSSKSVRILMEYVPNGSVIDFVSGDNKPSTRLKVSFCRDIAKGMEYLERKNHPHRDLQASKCLVTSDERVKICDHSIHWSDAIFMTTKTKVPSPRWQAPETLRESHRTVDQIFRLKGTKPYAELDDDRDVAQGLAGGRLHPRVKDAEDPKLHDPSAGPQDVVRVLRWYWDRNPDFRPTFKSIVHHEWEHFWSIFKLTPPHWRP